MPRLSHGTIVTESAVQSTQQKIISDVAGIHLNFIAAAPGDLNDFDFLFPELQNDAGNLLPEGQATRDALVELGRAMQDNPGEASQSAIPVAYTYLGQFIDHDITLDVVSGEMPALLDPALAPMNVDSIRNTLKNGRTATLDLDSVYGLPAPRDGDRMLLGKVTPLNGNALPTVRPAGKDDSNDLPREPRNAGSFEHDRAALTGDPRNDENTIISQLHVAFLRSHNALVDRGMSFRDASTTLRQHYQHIVLRDFLPRIADPAIVASTIASNRIFDALAEPFFMPFEFSVAAYRFGHSMVRGAYDFNLNFNLSGGGAIPASLNLLFTFTALAGQLGNFETLPDNWIIEWERLLDRGGATQLTRRIDPGLVEPLMSLTNEKGEVPPANAPDRDRARLAVRNLLRGYLLRIPTGQAVVQAVNAKLPANSQIIVLSPADIEAAATNDAQRAALASGGFFNRTPLWYYILAEARARANGRHLGPLGSLLVSEVLVGLVRRSDNSILRTAGWVPTLPSERAGDFALADLLRLAGVLAPLPPTRSTPTTKADANTATIVATATAPAGGHLLAGRMVVTQNGILIGQQALVGSGSNRRGSVPVPSPGTYTVTIFVTAAPGTQWVGTATPNGNPASSGTRAMGSSGNDSFFMNVTAP